MLKPTIDRGLVRIASALNCLHLLYGSSGKGAPELDALLRDLFEAQVAGNLKCSADLVRERRFGTLPTVTARIAKLVEQGLLKAVIGSDRRIHLLEVTPKGMALLAARDRLFAGDGGAGP